MIKTNCMLEKTQAGSEVIREKNGVVVTQLICSSWNRSSAFYFLFLSVSLSLARALRLSSSLSFLSLSLSESFLFVNVNRLSKHARYTTKNHCVIQSRLDLVDKTDPSCAWRLFFKVNKSNNMSTRDCFLIIRQWRYGTWVSLNRNG